MEAIAANILAVLKRQLGDRWDRLSRDDASLLEACAADAAALQVRALATDPNDAAAQAALLADKRQIDAQLANFAAMGAAEVQGAFWEALKSVVGVLIPIALAAL